MPFLPVSFGHRARSVFTFLTLVTFSGPSIFAQSLYWDANGSLPGTGSPNPSGIWDTTSTRWNDATGTGIPIIWGNTGLETAIFAAGTDATGPYTVTLGSGTVLNLSGLTVNAGQVTINAQGPGNSLNFGSLAAALFVDGSATLRLQAAAAGTGGLIKSGTGLLELDTSTIPTGALVVNAGELRIAPGQSLLVDSLTLGGGAGVSSTLSLATGSALNLNGNITFSTANTPLQGTLQGGGIVNLNGTRSITVQNLTTDPDLVIDTTLADGNTASGISKAGAGTLVLKGVQTYTGPTVLGASSGTLIVQGNTASIAASSELNIGAASTATVGDTADSASINRLGDTAAVILAGGAAGGAVFNYNAPDLASAGIHQEKVGALTVAGENRSTLTLQSGTGDQAELRFTSLTRADNAVALVRGGQLGAVTGTADSSRIFFDSAPTLTGGILPWVIVDATATGSGAAFATYDPARGLVAQSATVAPASAVMGANVVKSVNGNVSFNTSIAVNSWTNSSTGITTLGSGVTLGLQSGAMLFTVTGTFNGGILNLGNDQPGTVHLASGVGVTATIHSLITGTQGLILSGAGAGNKILSLSGNNTFTGGVNVYAGILSVASSGALNASGSNALTVQAGGTVRLNGNEASFSGLSGSGIINSNSGATPALLKVNGGGNFSGTLVNGTVGSLAITKTGSTTLTLGGVNTYTGPTLIQNGVLQLNGTGGNPGTNGRLTATSSVQIQQGATLRINKGNGVGSSNNADRLNDAAPITLSGGTLNFSVNGNNIVYTETVGSLTLTPAASQISSGQAGETGTSTLTISGLTSRAVGATLNFAGAGLGTTLRNRVEIIGLTPGFVGGWATVGNEFAKYVTDVDSAVAGDQSSITPLTAADYNSANANDTNTPWTSASHVKPAVDQGVAQGLDVSREVASVNLGSGIDLALGTNTLTILSGGILKQAGNVNGTGSGISQITGGTLTAGNTEAPNELFVRVTGANLTLGSVVADNLANGSVTLVKTGAGTVNLNAANTFTGGVFLNEGTLRANNTAGSATGTGSLLTAVGTTLGGMGFITPGLNAHITLQGTLSVGNLSDTVARDLALSVSGTGTLSLGGAVLLDLFTNTGTGTQNSLTAADLLDVDAPSWSQVVFGSQSSLQVVTSLTATNFVEGDSWKLFDWSGITGGNAPVQGNNGFASLNLPALADGLQWDTSQLFTTGFLVVIVPEPSRVILLFFGLLWPLLHRRKARH